MIGVDDDRRIETKSDVALWLSRKIRFCPWNGIQPTPGDRFDSDAIKVSAKIRFQKKVEPGLQPFRDCWCLFFS